MGKQTIRKKKGSQARPGTRKKVALGWMITVGTVAVAVAMLALLARPKTATAPQEVIEATGADVLKAEIGDPRVGEVERRFVCPCGTCGKELDECSCETAMKMKSAIVALLGEGRDVDSVVATLSGRFPGALKAAGEVAGTAPVNGAAGSDTFLEVTQRLDCPCGNCQLRLADCDCDHDRGAHEVKAFIRERIRDGRTASEIIAAFDRVYGRVSG
ncbi:MAG: hypothetical protein GXP47_03820 [Acidobacteria bacterium]|nr:hypothetical protein [Acidobacteriota bacterium]